MAHVGRLLTLPDTLRFYNFLKVGQMDSIVRVLTLELLHHQRLRCGFSLVKDYSLCVWVGSCKLVLEFSS